MKGPYCISFLFTSVERRTSLVKPFYALNSTLRGTLWAEGKEWAGHLICRTCSRADISGSMVSLPVFL